MSIDLKIAPSSSPPIWGQVRRALGTYPVSLEASDGQALRDDEPLALGAIYEVVGPGVCAADVYVASNEDTMLSPSDWLAAHGKNLADSEAVAAAWANAGYYISIESRMGRGDNELAAVAALAAALADATNGLVVISQPHSLDLAVGAYTSEEVRRAGRALQAESQALDE